MSSDKNISKLTKVWFNLDPDWHCNSTETLWAEHLSRSEYRLKNSPFLKKGVSYGDIVTANLVNGILVFDRVLRKSGNSTYRLLVDEKKKPKPFECYWLPLKIIGCSYEESANFALPMLAVNVPSDTNIFTAFSLLEKGEKCGVWDFEEGDCGHKV